MGKEISIILPVYNGEKFLARCLDSILNQTYKSFLILAIDDGSRDNSLKILEQYQQKYPKNIKVYSQKNMGVAKTRNVGISSATGKYVMFIDQDDFIDSDYCAVLFNAAEIGEYDVVYSGMKRPNEYGKIVGGNSYKNPSEGIYFARFMCMAVWAKIYRTRFLQENNLRLFSNPLGEDIAFTFEEAQKSNNVKCINYTGYNWFYNTTSVSNTAQQGLDEKNVGSVINLQNKLSEVDIRKDKTNEFFIIMVTAYYIFFSGKGSTPKQFIGATEVLMSNLTKHYPRCMSNRYLLKAPKGTLLSFSVGVKVFIVLYRLRLLPIFARIYCKG